LADFEHPGRISILRFGSRGSRLRLADRVEMRAPLAIRQAPKPPLRLQARRGLLIARFGLGVILHLQEHP
jgi:hypothetical protein